MSGCNAKPGREDARSRRLKAAASGGGLCCLEQVNLWQGSLVIRAVLHGGRAG